MAGWRPCECAAEGRRRRIHRCSQRSRKQLTLADTHVDKVERVGGGNIAPHAALGCFQAGNLVPLSRRLGNPECRPEERGCSENILEFGFGPRPYAPVTYHDGGSRLSE